MEKVISQRVCCTSYKDGYSRLTWAGQTVDKPATVMTFDGDRKAPSKEVLDKYLSERRRDNGRR